MSSQDEPAAQSAAPILDYRASGKRDDPAIDHHKVIVVPQSMALFILFAIGGIAVMVSLSMRAYGHQTVWETLLMAWYPDFAERQRGISIACIVALLGIVLFPARMYGWPLPLRLILVVPLFAIWLPWIQHFERRSPAIFHGYYVAAFGCTLIGLGILLAPSSDASTARRMMWCIPLGPLFRFELPSIHRHLDSFQPCCRSIWMQTPFHRAMGRWAIWSAAIALAATLVPFIVEFCLRMAKHPRGEAAGMAAWGLFLVLTPVILIFSLIGIGAGMAALVTPPRKIIVAMSVAICVAILLRFFIFR